MEGIIEYIPVNFLTCSTIHGPQANNEWESDTTRWNVGTDHNSTHLYHTHIFWHTVDCPLQTHHSH